MPCALWVVNQLNDRLGIINALIAIVMIGALHVQLSDDGASVSVCLCLSLSVSVSLSLCLSVSLSLCLPSSSARPSAVVG